MATTVRPPIHHECDTHLANHPHFKPKSRLKNIFYSIVNALSSIASKFSSISSSLRGRASQLFAKPKETFDLGLEPEDIISGASIDSQVYTQNQPKRLREERIEQAKKAVCTTAILALGVAGAFLFIKDLCSKN